MALHTVETDEQVQEHSCRVKSCGRRGRWTQRCQSRGRGRVGAGDQRGRETAALRPVRSLHGVMRAICAFIGS